MPIVSLHLLGLLWGLLFSWSAREVLHQADSRLNNEAAWTTLAFGILIYAPSCLILITHHSDWALGFIAPSGSLPRASFAALGLSNATCVPLGFLLGCGPVRAERPIRLLQWGGGLVALLAINTTLFWSRLGIDASHLQFKNDFGTRSLPGTALGYALLWLTILVTGSAVWTHRRLSQARVPSATDRPQLPKSEVDSKV